MGDFFKGLEGPVPTFLVMYHGDHRVQRACLVEGRDEQQAIEVAQPLLPPGDSITTSCMIWPGEPVPVGFLNRPLSEIEWRAILEKASIIWASSDQGAGGVQI